MKKSVSYRLSHTRQLLFLHLKEPTNLSSRYNFTFARQLLSFVVPYKRIKRPSLIVFSLDLIIFYFDMFTRFQFNFSFKCGTTSYHKTGPRDSNLVTQITCANTVLTSFNFNFSYRNYSLMYFFTKADSLKIFCSKYRKTFAAEYFSDFGRKNVFRNFFGSFIDASLYFQI